MGGGNGQTKGERGRERGGGGGVAEVLAIVAREGSPPVSLAPPALTYESNYAHYCHSFHI